VTSSIPRYPAHLIDVIRVAGRRVTLRPALPQDTDLQRTFFAGLSDEARYFRFMTRLPGLTATLAECFSDIDHERHVAILAGTCTQAEETIVGEARYVVEASDPETCEFALRSGRCLARCAAGVYSARAARYACGRLRLAAHGGRYHRGQRRDDQVGNASRLHGHAQARR